MQFQPPDALFHIIDKHSVAGRASFGPRRTLDQGFIKGRLRRFYLGRLLADAVEDGVRFQLAATMHAETAGLTSKTLMPQTHHEFVTYRTPLRRVVRLQSEEVLVSDILVQHQGRRPRDSCRCCGSRDELRLEEYRGLLIE